MRHTYILSALAALAAMALVSVSPEQVSAAGGGRGAVPSLDAVPQSASPSGKEPAFPGLEKAGTHTVYAGQLEITEPELQRFISVLPGFRTWVKSRGVTVRPTVTKGKPDFSYPPEVGSWLSGMESRSLLLCLRTHGGRHDHCVRGRERRGEGFRHACRFRAGA